MLNLFLKYLSLNLNNDDFEINKKKLRLNVFLFFIMLFIILLGLVNVLTSTAYMGLFKFNHPFYFFKKHILWICIGLFCQLFLMLLPLTFLRKVMNFFFFVIFFILCLIFIPYFYSKSGGAMRWLRIGFISFQPSEFVKVFLVFFLSYSVFVFEKIRCFLPPFSFNFWKGLYLFAVHLILASPDYIRKESHFLYLNKKKSHLGYNWPYLALWIFLWGGGVVLLVFLQRDLGGGIVIFSLVFYFFVTRVPLSLILLSLGLFISFVIYAIVHYPFRMRRLLTFLNPYHDPVGDGYQLLQSLNGFFSGGFLGQGFENSFQSYLYLPAGHTDFAFSIWAEQFGLVGCLFVIFLYLILISLIYRIGRQSRHVFLCEFSFATMWMFSVQVMVNLGVVTGLLPTKGLVLPLFNFGGSSLLTNMVLMGWVMRVDKERRLHKNIDCQKEFSF